MKLVAKALPAVLLTLVLLGCSDITLRQIINQDLGLSGDVAAPTFNPAAGPAGTYTSATSVTLSTTTAGASIRYTTDGSAPSSTIGTPYTGPVSVGVSQTINAIAYRSGWSDSTVAVAGFANPAATIRVGSIAASRAGTTWTLDGASMADTRAKLLNTANFGPTGTVTKQILITDTAATIDANMLANFDTVFISDLPNGTLTTAERAALSAWENNGGWIVVTADDSSHDDVASDYGGCTSSPAAFIPPTMVTGLGITLPLFLTPYSNDYPIQLGKTSNGLVSGGLAKLLTDSMSTFMAVGKIILGSGQVIFLSDVSMITSTLSGSLTTGSSITSAGDKFLVNLFAYAHK